MADAVQMPRQMVELRDGGKTLRVDAALIRMGHGSIGGLGPFVTPAMQTEAMTWYLLNQLMDGCQAKAEAESVPKRG